MIRTFSILLLVAILWPMLMRDVIVLSFYLQRDRIARELCEEKANASSCCKGSCVLKKELQKTREDEHSGLPELRLKTEIASYIPGKILSLPDLISFHASPVEYYLPPVSDYIPITSSEPPVYGV